MSADYSHLHATSPTGGQECGSRIRHIRTDRWIAYTRAEGVIAAMEELSLPKRTRMPNFLLVGPTNNGKTMIVEKFRRSHPPIEAAEYRGRVAACRF